MLGAINIFSIILGLLFSTYPVLFYGNSNIYLFIIYNYIEYIKKNPMIQKGLRHEAFGVMSYLAFY